MRESVEVSVAVTPCMSNSTRSLPLGGVGQRLKLDVALTPGVLRVTDSSRGWELLLLLCHNSAAFCRHSHAVVLWNEARREEKSQTRNDTRTIAKTL